MPIRASRRPSSWRDVSTRSRSSCVRRRVSAGSCRPRASDARRTRCCPRSTADSPKVSTRPTYATQKRCSMGSSAGANVAGPRSSVSMDAFRVSTTCMVSRTTGGTSGWLPETSRGRHCAIRLPHRRRRGVPRGLRARRRREHSSLTGGSRGTAPSSAGRSRRVSDGAVGASPTTALRDPSHHAGPPSVRPRSRVRCRSFDPSRRLRSNP